METASNALEGIDKLVHVVAFAVLAFPLARTGRFGLVPIILGAVTFGGLIELIQPIFNRNYEAQDWIADILGVILGVSCGVIYRRLKMHQEKIT